jgi:hypothetical protein
MYMVMLITTGERTHQITRTTIYKASSVSYFCCNLSSTSRKLYKPKGCTQQTSNKLHSTLKLFRKHWSAPGHIASLTFLKLTTIHILVVKTSHDRKSEIKSQDAKSIFKIFRGG